MKKKTNKTKSKITTKSCYFLPQNKTHCARRLRATGSRGSITNRETEMGKTDRLFKQLDFGRA